MSEDLRKVCYAIVIAMSAGFARHVATGGGRSFTQFIQGLFLAGFVGGMTGLALQQTSLSEPFKGFVIGLVAFAGEDVLLGVLKMSRGFAENPRRYLRRWLDR